LRGMRTSAKVLAMLAGSALALSGCASGDSDGGSSSSTTAASTTFTWAYDQEFAAYNNKTADQNAAANAVVLNPIQFGFTQYGPDGGLVKLSDFGSYEKTSDNPLTVKYTINDKAVWSDGNPVDCDDLVLAWLANNGTTGDKGFSTASTLGYEDMNKPQCNDGDKTVTITYKTAWADWESAFIDGDILPAHIVEKGAGVADVIAASDDPTSADVAKLANFYNTAWKLSPGQLKTDIMPSDGPYVISKWQAGQSLTLTANDKWWGAPVKTKTIVIRYIADDAMAQALQNGEADAMDPQPAVDLVNQLKALGTKIKVSESTRFDFEHMDFNFKTVFKDKNVREAFAKCIPRQQIVDNLIKPMNADAVVLESRFYMPFQDEYASIKDAIGANAYDKVDIAGAKQLLGGKTVNVRVGWRKDPAQLNKRRADTISLLQASCKPAGFNVIDHGTADFFANGLSAGDWDLALFAWTSSALVTPNGPLYQTKAFPPAGSNNGKYSNPRVDALFDQLKGETDKTKQAALLTEIDTIMWSDVATVPLFAFPAILAVTPEVTGVVYNASQADLSWNCQEWGLTAK